MRRYDDPVEVRTGEVTPEGVTGASGGDPEQFLWRGQLWQVSGVLAHWVETGEWWRGARARAVAGTERLVGAVGAGRGDVGAPALREVPSGHGATRRVTVGRPDPLAELLEEREVWRVEARRPRIGRGGERGVETGVFDLALDVAAGRWQLLGCTD